MKDFTFVLNPAAGKGAGARAANLVEQILKGSGLRYRTVRTEGAGHATEIARTADTACVVAVGGDGTINEVANGLVGTGTTMAVIPTGSGNDFIKSIGVPRSVRRAMELLWSGTPRMIDAGRVETGSLADGSIVYAPGRYFVNGVGVGFDASVARRVAEIRWLRGTALYLLAVLQTLGKFRPPVFQVAADGAQWEQKHLLVATGNGPCAGGGFYLTPGARVDDGLLDVAVIDSVPVLKILGLIPGVMAGKRVEKSFVRYLQVKHLELSSESTFNVHADGEIVGREVHGVRMRVEPGVLRVIGGVSARG